MSPEAEATARDPRLDGRPVDPEAENVLEIRALDASRASVGAAVEVDEISRSFDGGVVALDRVSLTVAPGTIHAVLGPNGAGKTTLLRLLSGLVEPTSGNVRLLGVDPRGAPRALRRLVGLIPSGDRSFYLRISALENLVFFARLYGFRRREALVRAREALAAVDLHEAAGRPVGSFSHGMHKRLSVARALLHEPAVLLVDEATHDLDPLAARRVRDLVREAARDGAAVLWATQRIEEVRGFADVVTVLSRGRTRFTGSVSKLVSFAEPRHYLVRLRLLDEDELAARLGAECSLRKAGEIDETAYVLTPAPDVTLGDALLAIHRAGAEVLHCTELESNVEEAFLAIVGAGAE